MQRLRSALNKMKKENDSGVQQIPAELIANAIIEIQKSMNEINKTRLSRKAIVTLIHAHSSVPKKQIELVLNNLDSLAHIWLKPSAAR